MDEQLVDSRHALRNGLASYCHTEDEARALARAGIALIIPLP